MVEVRSILLVVRRKRPLGTSFTESRYCGCEGMASPMGCENELNGETLTSARSPGDASSALKDSASKAAVRETAKVIAAVLDGRGDQAILASRAGQRTAGAAERAAYGDIAESAVARFAVEVEGQDVVHLNTRPGEKGIDLITFDNATGELTVWEVKSSVVEGSISRAPALGRTLLGKQMSESWLNDRLSAAGLSVAAATDVQARVVKVDLAAGQAQVWRIDPISGAKARSGAVVDIEDFLDLQS